MRLYGAEDMLPLEGKGQGAAFLLTAAASFIWVSPTYLKNQVSNLEMELLKAERVATSLLDGKSAHSGL